MENEQPVGTSAATTPATRIQAMRRRLRWWFDGIKRRWTKHREIVGLLPQLRHGTEKELRELILPFPDTERDALRIVRAVLNREHDYGSCCYAMSIAANAMFNYAASKHGCTGFQASCADLDFLRRTRLLKHGFQIIKYDDLLYPQYADKFPTRAQLIRDNIDQLGKAAEEMLADSDRAHPNVRRWWEDLVDMRRVHLASLPTS